MKQVNFLDKVTCKLTKRTGVIYGIAKYMYEVDQFMVVFEGEKQPEWVSASNVDIVID